MPGDGAEVDDPAFGSESADADPFARRWSEAEKSHRSPSSRTSCEPCPKTSGPRSWQSLPRALGQSVNFIGSTAGGVQIRGQVGAALGAPHEKAASAARVGARRREKARTKPRSGRRRKQARTHHLGRLDARRAVQTAVRHSEHSDKRSCLKRTKPVRDFPQTNAKDATDELGPTDTGESR